MKEKGKEIVEVKRATACSNIKKGKKKQATPQKYNT